MSHSKETPRQKMIGMMYLVLTCLLALNVSKEVLQGFVTINDSIETTNSNFTSNTKMMMEALEESIKAGRNEAKPYFEKAKEVNMLTQKAFDYITELKQQVQQYTEGVKGADTMKLAQIQRLDDYDKPTFLLIGSDETKPNSGKFSAKELRNNMTDLSTQLTTMIDLMHKKDGLKLPDRDYLILKDKLKLFTPHDKFKDKEGKPLTWEMKNFYNMPLAAVITNFSKIQSDIRNIEAEMVTTFAAASGKLAIKFNELQARIVPVSQYVQTGSPFTADVFLSASSTDFTNDNLQFILGDVDTSTGNLVNGAVALPIDKGTGKINLPTSSAGHKEIKGWIKFRDAGGKYKYFKYYNEYIVANSAVAVSADKMNVIYIGVDNPITVSAAGVAPTDLVVTSSGCGSVVKTDRNVKFSVTAASTGTFFVKVAQRTAEGLKPQGQQMFRVKKFPNPPLRVNGKSTYDNLEMTLSEAKTVSAIGVDNSGFEFNAPFKVISYNMSFAANGKISNEFICAGSGLSQDAKAELSKIKKGTKIFVENVKVMAPDGQRNFPNMRITVK
jgi:gliding motility-associated protein GldM